MKKCSACKKEKNESEFNKDCTKKDGLSNNCKDCKKVYRENNKEKIAKQQHKKWMKISCSEQMTIENRNKINEWRKNNKEKVAAYNKVTRAKDRKYKILFSKIKEVAQEDEEVINSIMNYVINFNK